MSIRIIKFIIFIDIVDNGARLSEGCPEKAWEFALLGEAFYYNNSGRRNLLED